MAITFPALRANSDKQPNIDQHPSVVLVPAVTSDPAWTLNNLTIESDGSISGSAVAQGSYAERYVPGLVQGHLYKVTYSYINTLTDVAVSLGGQTIFTMLSGQNKSDQVTYFVFQDGDKLKLDHSIAANYTGGLTALVIEAVDPLNIDLIPDA